MSDVFTVVGEHRDDSDRLLLIGAAGQYYAHAVPYGITTPITPDDRWFVHPQAPPIET
jgi:hypothetical protein